LGGTEDTDRRPLSGREISPTVRRLWYPALPKTVRSLKLTVEGVGNHMDILRAYHHCLKYSFLALHEIWLSWLASSWPRVSATIRHFHVEPKTFPVEFRIVYTYSYQGKRYGGYVEKAVLWGGQRLRERFPDGSVVDVHVDPQQPPRSYLPTEVDRGWLLLTGITALAISGALLYIGLRDLFRFLTR